MALSRPIERTDATLTKCLRRGPPLDPERCRCDATRRVNLTSWRVVRGIAKDAAVPLSATVVFGPARLVRSVEAVSPGDSRERWRESAASTGDAPSVKANLRMGALMHLHLGTRVDCTDGAFGELDDIVIVPHTRRVTHLVIAPRHHHSDARLAPIELIAAEAAFGSAIGLRCTRDEARSLPATQDFAYVRLAQAPPQNEEWDVGRQRVLTLPMRNLGSGPMYPFDDDPHVSVVYDRIPPGAVEVAHSSEVTGADGRWMGYLDGLSVDDGGTILDVTFESGHLWRRHRMTVPSSVVADVAMDRLTLALSRSEIDALIPAHASKH
jgi:hypothetical protein